MTTDYLLGLVTLPVAALVTLSTWAVVAWVIGWRTNTRACGICGLDLRSGPWKTARLRLHCRRAHGLALTLGARVRRRQWHGLSLPYAIEQGATPDEWRAAVAASQGLGLFGKRGAA